MFPHVTFRILLQIAVKLQIASDVYCYDNYPSYSKFYGFCSFLCSREKRLKTKYTAMFPRESIIAESKHTTAGRGRFL